MAGMQISQSELDALVEEAEHLSPEEVKLFLDMYADRTLQRRNGSGGHKYKDMTDAQKQSRREYNTKRRHKEQQMLKMAKEMGLIPK